jgi:hypothetical protein
MRIVDHLTNGSLWDDIVAARFVGVALLALTLLVSLAVFRSVGFTRGQSLLALVCIGCLPLSSWVAGYVQPENLSFFCVTLFLWLAIRWQRRGTVASLLPPVLSIGALFFTKQHYALCCWAALFLTALPVLFKMPRIRGAVSLALIFVVPAVCFKFSFGATYASGMSYASQTFSSAGSTLSTGLNPLLRGLVQGVESAYLGGDSFTDFWFRFGMRGETIFPGAIAYHVRPWLVTIMLLAFAAFGFAQYRTLHRIEKVARHRSKVTALRLTVSSVPLNVYVMTALLLMFNFVRSGGLIWIEGRYWLPVTVAYLVLLGQIGYGARRPLQRRVQYAILATLAVFCLVSSAAGLRAIGRVYYDPPTTSLAYDSMAEILQVKSDGQSASDGPELRIRKGEPLEIDGFAVDPRTGLPAREVVAKVDGGQGLQAIVGLPESIVASAYSDDLLLDSGFRLHVGTERLTPGTHILQLFVNDPALGTLPLRNTLVFTLT